MPPLLICSRDFQSSLQFFLGIRHFALRGERLRLTFIRHERKPCIGIRAACLDGSLEKRQSLSISLRFIEAVAKHLKKSNLASNVAARLGRQICVTDHYRGASSIPFEKGYESEFSFCPRFP